MLELMESINSKLPGLFLNLLRENRTSDFSSHKLRPESEAVFLHIKTETQERQ